MSENTDNFNEEEKEVKPVKLSRGKIGIILIGGIIILLIGIITVRSCSIEKKVNTSQNQGTTQTATVAVTEPTQIVGENGTEISENNPNLGEGSSSSAEVVSSAVSSQNGVESQQSSSKEEPVVESNVDNSEDSKGKLSEVSLPSLGNEIETTGIVTSKHVYRLNDNYVYGVTISMLVGEGTQTVQYLCPKNTYEMVSSADAIVVKYQLDSAGVVSISSISK